MSVTTMDGERLELFGQTSLRELAVVVSGMTVEGPEGDGDLCDCWAELLLSRDQVVALRDELAAWLARGEL